MSYPITCCFDYLFLHQWYEKCLICNACTAISHALFQCLLWLVEKGNIIAHALYTWLLQRDDCLLYIRCGSSCHASTVIQANTVNLATIMHCYTYETRPNTHHTWCMLTTCCSSYHALTVIQTNSQLNHPRTSILDHPVQDTTHDYYDVCLLRCSLYTR